MSYPWPLMEPGGARTVTSESLNGRISAPPRTELARLGGAAVSQWRDVPMTFPALLLTYP